VFVELPAGDPELHATTNKAAAPINARLIIVPSLSSLPDSFPESCPYAFFANGRSRSVSAPLRPFSRLAFIQFFTVSV
jgi:hypothetical protein